MRQGASKRPHAAWANSNQANAILASTTLANATQANCHSGQTMFSTGWSNMQICVHVCGGQHLCKGELSLRARSISANFDFGQFRFPPISTSANFDFGQFGLRPIFWMLNFWPTMGGAPKGEGVGPNLEKVGARRVGAPNFTLFFPSPATVFIPPSLGGPFVDFGWSLKRRDPEMCTIGVLWLLCKAPAAPQPLIWIPAQSFRLTAFGRNSIHDARVAPHGRR